jgi:hypothetical protein
MKVMLALIVALVLAVASAASGDARLVSFTQSGGIAGRHVALAVSSAGVASVTANRRPRTWRLHASTLRRLRRLLAEARFDRVDPPPSHCADCFVYVVRYRGRRVSYDDSQARDVPRSVRTAVAELLRIARGGR